jgi:dihydroxy-acid dehydratase
VANGRLDVNLDEAELEGRREAWTPTPRPAPRGVLAKYVKLVQSANVGAICG